jgi:hypothetical protein
MATKKKARRTVMYSASGKKLYAVRDKSGKFKDIQRYSRAHAADIKRGSGAETKAKAKKASKKAAAAKRKVVSRVKSAAKRASTAAGKRAASARRAVKRVTRRVRRATGV